MAWTAARSRWTILNPAWLAAVSLAFTLGAVGCGDGGDAPTARTGAPLEASVRGGAVVLSRWPGEPAANERAIAPDLRISGLLYPMDITGLAGDTFAVLDRMEASVIIFDGAGNRVREFGRSGEGPGEFERPYALTGLGPRRVAVWDRRGRLTVMRTDGSVAATNGRVPGDARALFQRAMITQWTEPFQLSREDVTRRLGRLDAAHFTLRLQDDERFDESFMRSGGPRRFTHHVIVFDSLAQVVDTAARLPGPELTPALPASDIVYGMARERPYPMRPMWTAGDGWTARGHGADPSVTVRFEDGDSLVLRWPVDRRPLREADFDAFLDWEIEGYRRVESEEAYREVSTFPRAEWRAEIREYQRGFDRPQLMGLLGAGECLGILGFAPDGGPHGEASRILLVNVRRPGEALYLHLPGEPGFVRTLERNAIYRIAMLEDGTRSVDRYPVPSAFCGA